MKIKTIIVDDEPMARGIIKMHLSKLHAFEVVKECSNAIEAINILQKQPVDLLFLDIQMPELTGLDFLKTIKNPPLVVLATAYSEYAVDSYEFENVVDYLLKPITFERFLKTANRIFEKLKLDLPAEQTVIVKEETETLTDYIFLKADKKIHKVNHSDIIYFQGYGNYVKVFTKTQGMVMVLQKIQEFEDALPESKFIRIHKSYIISLASISTIEGNRLWLDKSEIPIGSTYKYKIDHLSKK
ncbi:MAG: response regulator transcription factor [Saprospiraceae bacterium]|nr:response regulator transcription factor [Saprospiraceae bacterium]MBP7645016.1 response regulator transcription factor [Saprospiraceae bacterium]